LVIERGELLGALGQLVGKRIWGVVANGRTGSHVDLLIGGKVPLEKPGGKVPLEKPLRNRSLPIDVKNNDSEFSLFLQCAWTFESGGSVTAWHEFEGPVLHHGLVDAVVQSVELTSDTHDLVLTVTAAAGPGCLRTNVGEDFDGEGEYSVFVQRHVYVVSAGGIHLESRGRMTVDGQ
jgi:hypothetical protein